VSATAPEIIAEMLECDIGEVKEMIYQPSVYRSPSVYSWNDSPWSFFCCPPARQRPPEGFDWEIAGHSWRESNRSRPVYGVRSR
jgi:hypothetical protein